MAAKTALKSAFAPVAVNDDHLGSTVRQLHQFWTNLTNDEENFNRLVWQHQYTTKCFEMPFMYPLVQRRMQAPQPTPQGPRLGIKFLVRLDYTNPSNFLLKDRQDLAKSILATLKQQTPLGVTLKYQADISRFPEIFLYGTLAA